MNKYDFKHAKEKYRELCRNEPDICIYMKDWYLDGATQKTEDWQVILVEENDTVVAAFPFGYQKRHGMYYIEAPWQCARMGIWIKKQKYRSKLSELMALERYVNEIINNLPRHDVFRVPFESRFTNWQPFFWNGFSEEIRYSMVINSKEEDYLPFISKERRGRIRKGMAAYRVENNKLSIDEYWNFLEKSYQSKGKILSYDKKTFKKLMSALMEEDACVIKSVLNRENEIVSACIIFKDENRCYHQFGTQMQGKDPNATSLAVYDAINSTLKREKTYDFEGSMIHGVCEFNASFNPVWEPYHFICRYSKKYKILNSFLTICREITGRG